MITNVSWANFSKHYNNQKTYIFVLKEGTLACTPLQFLTEHFCVFHLILIFILQTPSHHNNGFIFLGNELCQQAIMGK
jgi:hypothetical protein